MPKLEHFEYMLGVAQTKSISKAANLLYVSQPYLSQSLKELEEELGVQLMTRSNRGVVLTPAGEQFVKYGRQILQLVEKTRHLSELYQPPADRLAVSSIYSFTMLDLFESFTKTLNPQTTRIYYEEIPNCSILEKVRDRRSDLGLVYLLSTTEGSVRTQIEDMELTFQPLCQEPLYAVVGYRHPLAKQPSVTLAQLEEYPLLVEKIKGNSQQNSAQDNLLFPHLFTSNQKMPIVFDNNRSLMYYLTKSERCFSVGQKSLNLSNPFYISRELSYIPITGTGTYTITGMVFRGQETPSSLLKQFMASLTRFFDGYQPDQV